MSVYVHTEGLNIDKALKKFKKAVKNSNIMMEIFERQQYDKPSKIKREKRMKAASRNKYKAMKEREDLLRV